MEGEVIQAEQPIIESEPQVTSDVATETQPPVEENSNDADVIKENGEEQPPAPPAEKSQTEEQTKEQLEARLQEYKVKEQEALELRNRLGIEDDSNFYLDTIDASIDNKFQQQWITLCNKFGVDHTENGVEKSLEELMGKDPKAYVQFKEYGAKILNDANLAKAEVRATRLNQGIGEFVEQNKTLLEASPIVNQIVNSYIQSNYDNLVSPKEQLGSLMDSIKMIYAEAIEVGRQSAKLEVAEKDRSGVNASSSVATANTSGYDMQTDKVFTRSQIAQMSTEEFDRNYPIIEKLYREGKIQ